MRTPELVAPQPGFRRLGIDLSDQIEEPRVGGRVGPGSPPDGGLVDGDHLIDELHARMSANSPGFPDGAQGQGQGPMEGLVDQGALARSETPVPR